MSMSVVVFGSTVIIDCVRGNFLCMNSYSRTSCVDVKGRGLYTLSSHWVLCVASDRKKHQVRIFLTWLFFWCGVCVGVSFVLVCRLCWYVVCVGMSFVLVCRLCWYVVCVGMSFVLVWCLCWCGVCVGVVFVLVCRLCWCDVCTGMSFVLVWCLCWCGVFCNSSTLHNILYWYSFHFQVVCLAMCLLCVGMCFVIKRGTLHKFWDSG